MTPSFDLKLWGDKKSDYRLQLKLLSGKLRGSNNQFLRTLWSFFPPLGKTLTVDL